MIVEIKRVHLPFHMQAFNEAGKMVEIDAAAQIGGSDAGMRPMQLVLAALGGCAAIDVIDILSKQRLVLQDIRIKVEGQRAHDQIPAVFKQIHLHFTLTGDIPLHHAQRAVALSVEKYCSVAAMLRSTAEISYGVEVFSP
ncbi:MAG: OsmC family protein [Cytophagales bacterium]|nr:OsmC family protein [Bernardetiaceae bacterium]MDW8211573.1 OsmC family protein [Cytophagales bacterium]